MPVRILHRWFTPIRNPELVAGVTSCGRPHQSFAASFDRLRNAGNCLMFWLAIVFLSAIPTRAAPPIITSAAPDKVSVSFYRDPKRSQRDLESPDPLDPEDLQGFAMILEKRVIDLPAGEAVVRFEGVASGLNPKSVIVMAEGVGERNQDRRLISQRGLLDAFTGQRVTLRRFNKGSGKYVSESATIRSTPDRLIVQTKDGFEAIRCDGMANTLIYPNVPSTLTSKPTLSVLLNGKQRAGRQTVTLAYLAANFDWQANYLGEIGPDGQTLELTGLLTLASADQTSFLNAEAGAIAGTVLRAQPRRVENEDGEYENEDEDEEEDDDDDNPYSADNIDIAHNCWPYGSTGGRPNFGAAGTRGEQVPIRLSLRQELDEENMEIIVTANRVEARLEDVGDLKFYRIPFPTTVAASSIKAVAFLYRPEVKGELLYVHRLEGDDYDGTQKVLRLSNRKELGLGVPLPGGAVKLFQGQRERRALIFDRGIKDKTQSEDVDLVIDESSSDVDVDIDVIKESKSFNNGKGWKLVEVSLENWEDDRSVTVELSFQDRGEYRIREISEPVVTRGIERIWRVTLKPEEKRKLRFTILSRPEKDDE
jgi:hypothetical protein